MDKQPLKRRHSLLILGTAIICQNSIVCAKYNILHQVHGGYIPVLVLLFLTIEAALCKLCVRTLARRNRHVPFFTKRWVAPWLKIVHTCGNEEVFCKLGAGEIYFPVLSKQTAESPAQNLLLCRLRLKANVREICQKAYIPILRQKCSGHGFLIRSLQKILHNELLIKLDSAQAWLLITNLCFM